jgi:Acetyltransferase (GNAT) family
LLAFDGDVPVGWCRLKPCDALPWLNRMSWFQRVDDVLVWSMSFFFVRKGYLQQGVMTRLVFAALKRAKQARAAALEAYPVDTSMPDSSSDIFVNFLPVVAGESEKTVIGKIIGWLRSLASANTIAIRVVSAATTKGPSSFRKLSTSASAFFCSSDLSDIAIAVLFRHH